MADNSSSSNTAMVVILVLVLLALGAGFFIWKGGYFSHAGGGGENKINIDVKLPAGGSASPSNPQ